MADTNEIVLFHGTTEDSADSFLTEGWTPGSGQSGANRGNPRLLYLTTVPENALWFADQRGGSTVLEVRLPVSALVVDPEDGVGETVAEEFSIAQRTGLPANVASRVAIPADRFRLHGPDATPKP